MTTDTDRHPLNVVIAGGGVAAPETADGEVRGLDGVHAAGDATATPIEHGGLAAQQADLAAASIARRAGFCVARRPSRSTFRGALLTGHGTQYPEAVLADGGTCASTMSDVCPWDGAAKIAARHLTTYLADGVRHAVNA